MSLSSGCDDFCAVATTTNRPPPTAHHQPPVDISSSTLRWASFLLFNLFAFSSTCSFLIVSVVGSAQGDTVAKPTQRNTRHHVYIYIYIYFDIREAAGPSSACIEYETRQPGLFGIFKPPNQPPALPPLVRTHTQALTGIITSRLTLFICS